MNVRRAIVAVAAIVATLGFTRLGVWQLDRAAQKLAIEAVMNERSALPPLPAAGLPRTAAEAAVQEHRAVVLEGRWDDDHTVYLENRPMAGRVGFVVLTPLVLADGTAVVVQRGWQPRDQADRTHVAPPPAASGPVQVQGRIALHATQAFQLGEAGTAAIRQNLDLAAFAAETRLRLRPWVAVQTAPADGAQDGLLRDWPAPATGVAMHYGYAFQWFAFSALAAGLYVWFQLIRPRRQRSADR